MRNMGNTNKQMLALSMFVGKIDVIRSLKDNTALLPRGWLTLYHIYL